MAFTANKNLTFHQRVQNFAAAIQNLREEGARLRVMFLQEVNGNSLFVNTEIATTAEIVAMTNYMADFKNFNENVAVGAAPRDSWLEPLTDTIPA